MRRTSKVRRTYKMPMTIQELTAEMNRFVEAMGWYKEDSPLPQTARNIAI